MSSTSSGTRILQDAVGHGEEVAFNAKFPEVGCTRDISRRAVTAAGLHENDSRTFWERQCQLSVDQLPSIRQEGALSAPGEGESPGSSCLLYLWVSHVRLPTAPAAASRRPSPSAPAHCKVLKFRTSVSHLLFLPPGWASPCTHMLHTSLLSSCVRSNFTLSERISLITQSRTKPLVLHPNRHCSALWIFSFLHSNNHHRPYCVFFYLFA